MAVWHRRAGKDSAALNLTACRAHLRKGTYWHMLPTANQARKAVWDGIDREGRKIIDQVFPAEIRSGKSEQEMQIELKCGSIWQCVGSDNYDRLVGSNPVGVVFSEYSLADPAAWDYIRPILAENGGWALFIYTPRGPNHGFKLYDMARANPGWFAEKLTIEDTKVIGTEIIEEERRSGMTDEMIQQEYWCSFDAAVIGTYYAKLLNTAEKEGRITGVPWAPEHQVQTWWDLGYGDSTAIWFAQTVGREVRIIDYYESSGMGLDHYAKVLKEKPYVYGEHLVPHDAEAGELGTGRKRIDTMASLGVRARVVAKLTVDDGINAVRNLLPRCWFDRSKCQRGLEALRLYRADWDETNRILRPKPVHDWTSHAADAFRYGAVGLRENVKASKLKIDTSWVV